jgi:hypothetical protein
VGVVRIQQKARGTCYAELVFFNTLESVGHAVHSCAFGRKMLTHNFSCSGGTGTDSTKVHQGMFCRTCVFAFDVICGSHSAFWCVRGMKHRCTLCNSRVGPIRIL